MYEKNISDLQAVQRAAVARHRCCLPHLRACHAIDQCY